MESARCKDASRYFNEGSSCYVFYDDPQTWHEARNRCLRNGGDLATFVNLHSNLELSKLTTSTHWIGLHSSWWTWLDGCQYLSLVLNTLLKAQEPLCVEIGSVIFAVGDDKNTQETIDRAASSAARICYPIVTLTLDLLTPKSNGSISIP